MTRLSSWFVASSPAAIHRALFVVRVALGVVFVLHGWQKIAVFGHAGVTQMFAGIGLPAPAVSAALAMTAEFAGGLALIAGLFTRPAAVALAFTMLVAMTQVHLANGFFLPNGFEYTFTLLLVNLAVVFAGPGAYSLDARLFAVPSSARPNVEPRWTRAA